MDDVQHLGERFEVEGGRHRSLSGIRDAKLIYDRDLEALYINPDSNYELEEAKMDVDSNVDTVVRSEKLWNDVVEEVWSSEHGSRRETPLEKPEYDSF